MKSAFLKKRQKTSTTRFKNIRSGGFVGLETKFYDTNAEKTLTAPTDSTGGEADPSGVNCLNAMAAGSGESERIGRMITCKKLNIRGQFRLDSAESAVNAQPQAVTCYVAVVLDMQTNKAQLNSEDVFTNKSADYQLATEVLRNLEYSKRFKVLRSKKIVLVPNVFERHVNSGNYFWTTGTKRSFSFDIPLNFNTEFVTTTAGVSSILDNSLHVIAFCDDTTFASVLEYNARLRYTG